MLRLVSTFVAVCVATTIAAKPVQAQSFLEKLEQTIKEQIQQDKNAVESAPTTVPPEKQQPPAAASQSPGEIKPGNQQASSQAMRQSAPANGVAQDPGSSQDNYELPAPEPTGEIYLGMEVEETPSGEIGVRVTEVVENSPAWKAGFQLGDRILAINGYAIANMESMVARFDGAKPGQSIKFLVSRAGRNRTLTAVLMDAGLADRIQGASSGANSDESAWFGVNATDLTASFRQQFGISVFRGAAVTGVEGLSPASKAGIRAGDVIIEADGSPIENVASLLRWKSNMKPGEKVEVMFYRGGFPKTVQVVLELPLNSPHRRRARSSVSPNPRTTTRSASPSSPTPTVASKPATTSILSQPSPNVPVPPPVELELEPSGPEVAVNTDNAAVEIQRLQAENVELKAELARVKEQLDKTKSTLDTILRELRNEK